MEKLIRKTKFLLQFVLVFFLSFGRYVVRYLSKGDLFKIKKYVYYFF